MRPIKTQLISHGAGTINEDIAQLNPSSAWILDGATGLSEKNIIDNESDARWFVQQWNEYLSAAVEDCDKSVADLIKAGIPIIKNKYYGLSKGADPQPIDLPSSGVALVRWNEEKLDYLVLGDCILIIKYAGNKISVVKDDCLQQLDEKAIDRLHQLMIESNYSFEDAIQEINPILVSHRLMKNTQAGYWILGFDEQALDNCIHAAADIKEISEIVLMSDGFAALIDKYHYTDESKIFDEVNHKGLASLYATLRQTELDDIEVKKYPRLKKSDDASAIAVCFSAV